MKWAFFVFFLTLILCDNVFPQESSSTTEGDINVIFKDVNSVVIHEDFEVKVTALSHMDIIVKKRVRVLNEAGKHAGDLYLNYNPTKKITGLRVIVNPDSDNERNISNKDIDDVSYGNMTSLYGDERLKIYRHIPTEYPYTIEFSYKITSSNTAFIPPWQPYSFPYQSVIESSYKITWRDFHELSSLEFGVENYPINKREEEYSKEYSLTNGASISPEELGPTFYELRPNVKFSLDKFGIEGVFGKANNWQEFGEWMYSEMIASQGKLSNKTKQEVLALVEGEEEPLKRAKIIYNYVQNKTRYVSVQVGIGGWKPMGAHEVDDLGYGDCKALTNYTKVLMDLADVESYYTVIYAGNDKRNINEELIGVQGNHVLLFLPTEEKDYWLECTSQTVPFGYQGTFTDDRNALLISEKNSRIIQTSSFKDEENIRKSVGYFVIREDRSLLVEMEINSGGVEYQKKYQLQELSDAKIDKHYAENTWSHLFDLSISEVNFIDDQEEYIFKERLKIEVPYYCEKIGSNMMFGVNVFNQSNYLPGKMENRKLPLVINRGKIELDDFILEIPTGYSVKELPEEIILDQPWGSYLLRINAEPDGNYRIQRKMCVYQGKYAKETYGDYVEYINQVVQGDRTKIILIKNL